MRIFSLLISLVMLGVVLGAGAFLYGYQQYSAKGPLTQEMFFVVEKGQGVSTIADNLEKQNVISNALIFKAATRIGNKHTGLKAGEYQFMAGISMKDVMDKLEAGDIYRRQFTIPEGLTSWQVVQILNGIEDLEGDIKVIPPEGSLLPETYQYRLGDTRAEKIKQMQDAMNEAVEEAWEKRPEDAPLLSKAEAIILASIIEKETGKPEERGEVAGVFHNRLVNGMPLQTDPTVIYAITKGKIQDKGMGPLGRRLLRKDLNFESPYNTYKYAGLPPGPIANPGKASIEAAINPDQHDYLDFVADGTGGHVFSKTLDEHNKNAAKWRQIRKSQGN